MMVMTTNSSISVNPNRRLVVMAASPATQEGRESSRFQTFQAHFQFLIFFQQFIHRQFCAARGGFASEDGGERGVNGALDGGVGKIISGNRVVKRGDASFRAVGVNGTAAEMFRAAFEE